MSAGGVGWRSNRCEHILGTGGSGHGVTIRDSNGVHGPFRCARSDSVVQVRWESGMKRSSWRSEHPTAKHYRGLLNNRPSVTWREVLDSALGGGGRGTLGPSRRRLRRAPPAPCSDSLRLLNSFRATCDVLVLRRRLTGAVGLQG